MMKKRNSGSVLWVKLISMAVICSLVTLACFSLPGKAAEQVKPVYVSLGDSIAAGYSLKQPEEQCYGALLAKIMGADWKQEAVSGMTSTELLEQISSDTAVQENLKQAQIVTVSIGSNDIMQPFLGYLAKELGCEKSQVPEAFQKLMNGGNPLAVGLFALAVEKDLEEDASNEDGITAGCKTFSEQLPRLIQTIRAYAPAAEIYVTNIYNPLKGLTKSTTGFDLESVGETYITQLNQQIHTEAETLNFGEADVYGNFKSSSAKVIHTDLEEGNIDPHPTVAGQRRIATLIYNSMLERHSSYARTLAEKGDVITEGGLKYEVSSSMVGLLRVSVKTSLKKNVTQITIPESVEINGFSYAVTGIGKNAFLNRKNLKKIIIQTTEIQSVGSRAFSGIYKKAQIVVPESVLNQYKKLFASKGQNSKVAIIAQ